VDFVSSCTLTFDRNLLPVAVIKEANLQSTAAIHSAEKSGSSVINDSDPKQSSVPEDQDQKGKDISGFRCESNSCAVYTPDELSVERVLELI